MAGSGSSQPSTGFGLESAVQLLTALHRQAEIEKRFGRVGVELVYKAGKLQLVEDTHRFTSMGAVA